MNWDRDALLLRGWPHDTYLCQPRGRLREGDDPTVEPLRASEGVWVFDRLWQANVLALRGFARRLELTGVESLSRFTDHELRVAIANRIKRGDLAMLRRLLNVTGTGANKALVEQRGLVQELARQLPGSLRFQGRRYDLTVGASIGGGPVRNGARVMRRDEAKAILSKMSEPPTFTAAARKLLKRAAELLSPDWRPPLSPSGLVLLQETSSSRGAPKSSDASFVTPQQIKALTAAVAPLAPLVNLPEEALAPESIATATTATTFFEVRFVDEINLPVAGLDVIFHFDGTTAPGTTDSDGVARLDGVTASSCQVEVDDTDQLRALVKERWDRIRPGERL